MSPRSSGTYAVEGGSLVFHPRFPLVAGVRYRAVFQAPQGKLVEATFDGPPRETISTTRVLHVYPSTDVLPSNTLKLYIYFSAPMSRGEAWQRIHLLDDQGQPLKFEFVEIQQELWDAQNTRLTVLFDPGRIKRGVLPEMELGPPIVEGKRYTLVIDREWKDARGVALQQEFRKSFRGGPADRMPPDPKTWRVTAPKAATSEALVVTFPKPMDYALLQRLFGVSDSSRQCRRYSRASPGRKRNGASRHANLGRRARTNWCSTPPSKISPAITSARHSISTSFNR